MTTSRIRVYGLATVPTVLRRWLAQSPDLLGWSYVAASLLLGPAIVLGAASLTRGGGDSCDSSYAGDWAARDAEFRAAQLVQVIGAGSMIAVGCVLAGVLITRRSRIGAGRVFLCALAIAAVCLGYGFLIAVSGYTTDCI